MGPSEIMLDQLHDARRKGYEDGYRAAVQAAAEIARKASNRTVTRGSLKAVADEIEKLAE